MSDCFRMGPAGAQVAGGLCAPILGGGIQSILSLCAGNLVVRRRGE